MWLVISHPRASSVVAPKLAPTKPVMTTIATASDISAPSKEQMAMASGEVIFRDKTVSRRVSGRPRSLCARHVDDDKWVSEKRGCSGQFRNGAEE